VNPARAGLEQALDLSENVLDEAKRDLGNSLFPFDKMPYCANVDPWLDQ